MAQAGQQSIGLAADFKDKIKEILNEVFDGFGMIIENGVAKFKTLFADKAQFKKVEMIDEKTGEIWCTWISDGEWQKTKGECATEATATTEATPTPTMSESPSSSPSESLLPTESPSPTPNESSPSPSELPSESPPPVQ